MFDTARTGALERTREGGPSAFRLVRAGGDAVLAIGGALPGGRIVRVLGALPPVRWAVDLGYRLVARHRHRIGRWLRLEGPACDVPR